MMKIKTIPIAIPMTIPIPIPRLNEGSISESIESFEEVFVSVDCFRIFRIC